MTVTAGGYQNIWLYLSITLHDAKEQIKISHTTPRWSISLHPHAVSLITLNYSAGSWHGMGGGILRCVQNDTLHWRTRWNKIFLPTISAYAE